MINEQKILNHLQNDLKLPLVNVNEHHWIEVKSTVNNVKKLVEFVEPLHYHISFFGKAELCIIPNS